MYEDEFGFTVAVGVDGEEYDWHPAEFSSDQPELPLIVPQQANLVFPPQNMPTNPSQPSVIGSYSGSGFIIESDEVEQGFRIEVDGKQVPSILPPTDRVTTHTTMAPQYMSWLQWDEMIDMTESHLCNTRHRLHPMHGFP